MTVNNSNSTGYYVGYNDNVNFTNGSVQNSGGDGFYVGSGCWYCWYGSTHVTISNATIQNDGGAGINWYNPYAWYAGGLSVQNTLITGNGRGIDATWVGWDSMSFENDTVTNNNGIGIHVTRRTAGAKPA